MSKRAAGSSTKAVAQLVKLIVPAGKATAQPPVGPALGAKGVKAMDFAKEFNARTAHLDPGLPTPALITIQPDRSFTFELRTPPTALLLKRAAGITTGSGRTGSEYVGSISVKALYEIAKIKMKDIDDVSEEAMCKTIAGQARSVGLRIVS